MDRQVKARTARPGFGWVVLVIALGLPWGCEERTGGLDTSSRPGAVRMDKGPGVDSTQILERVAVDEAIQKIRQTSTAPVGPVNGAVSFSSQDVNRYTPDPVGAGIKDIQRAKQIRLSLQECVALALANNYKIKTEGYGPAVSATDILKAEAAFDAMYFADAQYEKKNQPTPVNNQSSDSDTRTLTTGLQKRLSTGATVTGRYSLVRLNNTSLEQGNIDPQYTSNFLVELRQPLLRNFGVDVNRSQIEVNKNVQKQDQYKYREAVRDTLQDVERAYWRLVQARRNVVIQRHLVAQTEETLEALLKRTTYDVYQIQPTRVKALLGTRRAEYVQVKNAVGDAEDQLKALLNDPSLNLGEDVEIVPTDIPTLGPLVMDRISEVQAALECRSEIHRAKLSIENLRINVAVARNQALPQFDMVFQYGINGLSDNPDNSFDQMSTSNYQDYLVGLSLQYPIGNRAGQAAVRKALLQRDQGLAGLKQVIENVILEVDVAVRNLQTSYFQVPPSKEAVQAAEENLAAIVARKVKLSPEFLEVQLSAQETLANARRALLAALVNYNVSIVQLERAKDTLLRYNNVTVDAEIATGK